MAVGLACTVIFLGSFSSELFGALQDTYMQQIFRYTYFYIYFVTEVHVSILGGCASRITSCTSNTLASYELLALATVASAWESGSWWYLLFGTTE